MYYRNLCVFVNIYFFLGDKSRPTILRNSIDVATTPTIVDFLTEMGFRMDFEYILRGYMFRKGRMKITVSKIFKVGVVISFMLISSVLDSEFI